MVDGPGFRTSIYCAGCRHQCEGCHNPQSWDFQGGHAMTTEEIMAIIEADPYANVTFSGGDPMYQPEGFAELARAIRQRTRKTIWCYTHCSNSSTCWWTALSSSRCAMRPCVSGGPATSASSTCRPRWPPMRPCSTILTKRGWGIISSIFSVVFSIPWA